MVNWWFELGFGIWGWLGGGWWFGFGFRGLLGSVLSGWLWVTCSAGEVWFMLGCCV